MVIFLCETCFRLHCVTIGDMFRGLVGRGVILRVWLTISGLLSGLVMMATDTAPSTGHGNIWTREFYHIPLWGWGLGIVGAAVLYEKYKAKKSGQTTQQSATPTTATTNPATSPYSVPPFIIQDYSSPVQVSNTQTVGPNPVTVNNPSPPSSPTPPPTPPPTPNPGSNNPTPPPAPVQRNTTYVVTAADVAAGPQGALNRIASAVGHPASPVSIYDANKSQLDSYAASIGAVQSENVQNTHFGQVHHLSGYYYPLRAGMVLQLPTGWNYTGNLL